jgi:O-antigen/teichoic acid export membrane protein
MVIKINKVVKNFLSISFANIISQLFNFLVVAYYARILGSSIFGDLSTVQAIMIYFSMFVMLGLQTHGTRVVTKHESKVNNIVGSVVVLRALAFLISYTLIVVLSVANKQNIVFNQLMLLYGITLFPSALNLDWVFSGLQEMQYNAIFNAIKNLVPCILIFFFLKDKESFYLIPIFTVVGLFFSLLYQMYIYFIKMKLKISIIFSIKELKQHIKYGIPFMASGILSMINSNVDRILIKFTRGSAEAGIYSAGYTIIFFLINIITLIFTPIFPILIQSYHEANFDRLSKIIRNTARIISLIAFPIFMGGVLLSKQVILLLFKEEYISGYISFSILMCYILILFIREIYGYCLNAWQLEKKYLTIVFISSMCNLILNLILTPYYGMNVAALITVLSELINLILMRRNINKILKVEVFYYIRMTFIPTLIMGSTILILKYLNISVILNIITAVIVYFVAAIKVNYISTDDIRMIMSKKEGSL